MELIRGLVLPSRPDLPPMVMGFPVKSSGNLELRALYQVIDCELVEPIYPVDVGLAPCVMFGDEMGRYREDARPNMAATRLFGFPYSIVGTVVVFGDDPALGVSRDIDDSIVNHPILRRMQ